MIKFLGKVIFGMCIFGFASAGVQVVPIVWSSDIAHGFSTAGAFGLAIIKGIEFFNEWGA